MGSFWGEFATSLLLFAPLFFVLFLGGWIFGGGALLWVGGRFIVKAPKATFWRSVRTNVLAGLAGSVGAVLIINGLFAAAELAVDPVTLFPWFLLCGAAGLIPAWLVVMGMFGVSFRKAILAWLPTLGQAVLSVPLLIAILVPFLAHARNVAKAERCQSYIKGIATGISAYVEDPEGTGAFPPDLNILVPRGMASTGMLRGPPSEGEKPAGYFYLAPAPISQISEAAETLILCDYKGRHPKGRRNVLYADYHVAALEAEAFQSELAKPCNTAFARALRAAEGP